MIYAILRVTLEYMKYSLFFMKLKVIFNAEDRFLMSYFCFLQFKYVRDAMHRITSLELLGTLISGLEQKKLINKFKAHTC